MEFDTKSKLKIAFNFFDFDNDGHITTQDVWFAYHFWIINMKENLVIAKVLFN